MPQGKACVIARERRHAGATSRRGPGHGRGRSVRPPSGAGRARRRACGSARGAGAHQVAIRTRRAARMKAARRSCGLRSWRAARPRNRPMRLPTRSTGARRRRTWGLKAKASSRMTRGGPAAQASPAATGSRAASASRARSAGSVAPGLGPATPSVPTGASPAWPGLGLRRMGRRSASTGAWVFGGGPPRECAMPPGSPSLSGPRFLPRPCAGERGRGSVDPHDAPVMGRRVRVRKANPDPPARPAPSAAAAG